MMREREREKERKKERERERERERESLIHNFNMREEIKYKLIEALC